MLAPILVGTALFVLALVCSAAVTALIVRAVVVLFRRGYGGASFWKNVVVMLVATLLSAGGHFMVIVLWAIAFLACGAVADFETALYYSAVNYTTLGYGDIVIKDDWWRLLGPTEAVNGILLLGLSTAILFAILSRLFENRLKRGPAAEPLPSHRLPKEPGG